MWGDFYLGLAKFRSRRISQWILPANFSANFCCFGLFSSGFQPPFPSPNSHPKCMSEIVSIPPISHFQTQHFFMPIFCIRGRPIISATNLFVLRKFWSQWQVLKTWCMWPCLSRTPPQQPLLPNLWSYLNRQRANREVQTVNWECGGEGAVERGVKSSLKKAHKPWIRGKKGAQTVN